MAPAPPPSRDREPEWTARRRRAELEADAANGSIDDAGVAELDGCRRFEAAARKVIARAAVRPGFAGGEIRYAGQGTVWLCFARGGHGSPDDVVADFPWPDRVHTYRVARSLAELVTIHQSVADALHAQASAITDCVSWIAEEANVVRVLVPAADLVRVERMLAPLGDGVEVEGGSVMRAPRQEPRPPRQQH